MRQLTLFFALLLPMATCVAGKVRELESRITSGAADAYIGEEFRVDVSRAVAASLKGDDASAWALLKDALAFCDQQQGTPERRVFSVHNDAEAQEYRDAAPGVTTTFVDQACPAAYKAAGFLAVRANDADAALRYLDRAQALAPHWAEPLAERAYLVGKLGDRARSLQLYRDALAIAERYPSSAYLKPLILRGIGFALIELDQLDEAQKAFEASLQLDPGNELAQHELRYIERVRYGRAKGK